MQQKAQVSQARHRASKTIYVQTIILFEYVKHVCIVAEKIRVREHNLCVAVVSRNKMRFKISNWARPQSIQCTNLNTYNKMYTPFPAEDFFCTSPFPLEDDDKTRVIHLCLFSCHGRIGDRMFGHLIAVWILFKAVLWIGSRLPVRWLMLVLHGKCWMAPWLLRVVHKQPVECRDAWRDVAMIATVSWRLRQPKATTTCSCTCMYSMVSACCS